MGDFRRDNRDSRSGGGRSFGGGNRNFGGGGRGFDRERPQMHQTTCSNCGKTCEVPFRPNGSKPVFCSDCFRNQNQDTGRSEGRSFERPVFENRQDRNEYRPRTQETPNYQAQFDALNAKLDNILALITPPPPAPLESEIADSIIEEVVEEVIEEPKKEKATKKKAAAKKSPAKKKAK